MKFAIVSLCALAVGTALLTSNAWSQAPKAQAPMAQAPKADGATVDGTFVSAAAGKLTMTGADGKESTRTLSASAKYTIAGKAATLDGFKKGMKVKATTDRTGNVTALAGEEAAAGKDTTRK